MAAGNGHLEVLQWLRAQDPPCPWNEWTCRSAAGNGHLEVLQWLRAQDPPCPWDTWVWREAAENVVTWLKTQNLPDDWWYDE